MTERRFRADTARVRRREDEEEVGLEDLVVRIHRTNLAMSRLSELLTVRSAIAHTAGGDASDTDAPQDDGQGVWETCSHAYA